MTTIKITLKLFGSLREASGESSLDVDLDEGSSVADLRNWLAERNPLVEKLGARLAASVNLEMAKDADLLTHGDEVAFLPPVAGGDGAKSAKRCTISELALSEAEVIARVEGPDTGGIVSFIGAVRNHARGHQIEYLES